MGGGGIMDLPESLFHALYQENGGACYLLDLDALTRNYEEFLDVGRQYYQRFHIAYSVKANYAPLLIDHLRRRGAFAEVVSFLEYELVRRSGYEARDIIVNGPWQERRFIEMILHDGALLNLDSWYQLPWVADIQRQNPIKKFRLGIRLNFALHRGFVSRFGFDTDQETMEKLQAFLKEHHIEIESLHCHFCDDARSIESFSQRAQHLIHAYHSFFTTHPIQSFNAGGGFYSGMPESLRHQFGDVPEFSECVSALTRLFVEHFGADGPYRLFIEPGVALIADTGYFVCKVQDVKQVRGQRLALVDASIYNVKPTKSKRNLPMKVLGRHDTVLQGHTTSVVGFTCMEDDVLYSDYPFAISEGDLLLFRNIGAYSFVLKPPFIMPCQTIYVYNSGEILVTKKRETIDDILATYKFPEY
jgi:diaminopimelate decarboxylase